MILSILLAVAAATVPMGKSRIDLYAEAGQCVGDARRAEYVSGDGQTVAGCWVATQSGVFVVFLDGDIAQVPKEAIRKPTEI